MIDEYTGKKIVSPLDLYYAVHLIGIGSIPAFFNSHDAATEWGNLSFGEAMYEITPITLNPIRILGANQLGVVGL